MRLSVKPVKNYQNINSFEFGTEWIIRADEANQLVFQIVDLDQDGLRYISQATPVSVQVVFPAVNPANVITKTATSISAQDLSLWSVSLAANEKPSTGNVQFILNENGNIRRFVLQQGLVVEMFNQGGC